MTKRDLVIRSAKKRGWSNKKSCKWCNGLWTTFPRPWRPEKRSSCATLAFLKSRFARRASAAIPTSRKRTCRFPSEPSSSSSPARKCGKRLSNRRPRQPELRPPAAAFFTRRTSGSVPLYPLHLNPRMTFTWRRPSRWLFPLPSGRIVHKPAGLSQNQVS